MPVRNWQANGLLAALPEEGRVRLRPVLEPVKLEFNQVLYRPGEPLHYVYFPLQGLVSESCLSAHGAAASIGVVGAEGMVGLSSFLSGLTATTEARVLGAGAALRLESHVFAREFDRGEELQRRMLVFIQAFIAQAGQIAVCNRYHALDQQLCFWLLTCLERARSNELKITQEVLSSLLGVRREGITRAAFKLKRQGLLEYQRGRIIVPEFAPLQSLACECYRIVHHVYASLLYGDGTDGGTQSGGGWNAPGRRFENLPDIQARPSSLPLPTPRSPQK